ncbi:MAG: GNAT family N-acetyltransferase [Anaerolineae bacterium]|nr:GNAT family N-acetyltransferase [Anaerolineae bacterium]MDW8173967.1 GNAT family N-acetyltransferase [Anaerolineae bacterium]
MSENLSSYELGIPVIEDAEYYQHLTFGSYGYMLAEEHAVRLAAYHQGRPIGLVLALSHPQRAYSRLMSLFVLPEHRLRGLGTALVLGLEQLARARGDERLETSYLPPKAALARVLEKCGWQPPFVHMNVVEAPFATTGDVVDRYPLPQLPSNVTIFPWSERTQQDLAIVEARRGEYGGAMHPEEEPYPIASGSMGVRMDGRLMGWMIWHEVAPDLLRCSIMYLFPEARMHGLWLHMIAQGYHRQMAIRPYRNAVIPAVLPLSHFLQRQLKKRARVRDYHKVVKVLD